ncbi:MAG TPA: T9SS type A sorting domain-containing protein [Bacteroidales bacterium]|nr:T9SS type A sorting domain-containing protein [Bacteroidales bacterium]
MNKLSFSLTLLLLLILVKNAEAQKYIRNSSVTGICYAGRTVKDVSVPPPDVFYKKGGADRAVITINYFNFSTSAKAAFAYAASILESLLPSGTHITVDAYWQNMSDDVLGNSVITGMVAGWAVDALNPLVYYPVSVAEKIDGGNLNESNKADIEMRFNRSANWYYGTDAKPGTKYDLVTVVLHELCHGLGFFDSMNSENNIGYYGFGTIPVIYDTFIENQKGKKLIDTTQFKNNSASLNAELVSGSVYFSGPLHNRFTNGVRSRLYSPPVFDNGSSISHLDEDNSDYPLMTPFINPGEAIHNPGTLTLSILGDIGWINTKIIHEPNRDTEDALSELSLLIEVRSDTIYDKNFVGLVYSFDGFVTFDTILMNSPLSDGKYSVNVPIPSYNSGIQYYFFAEDTFNRLYRLPSYTDELKFSTFIGTDTVHPLLFHNPATYCFPKTDSIRLFSIATDNIGIDRVSLEYRINEGPVITRALTRGNNEGEYLTFLEPSKMNLSGGDLIFYRILAVDKSSGANVSYSPRNNLYTISVERIGSTLESFSTDFTNVEDDFFNSGFSISKPSGFSKYGLHTIHPYKSPETNDGFFEYYSMLRHPVKMNESGLLITFDEIVLVEPGEAGSTYPSEDFYDYVILEGSKDMGKTWHPLAPGYDSRRMKSWENTYNDKISGNNSTAIGDESMLREHMIFVKPGNDFNGGDEMLIRFRLYSDPFANGWGWVIQDLKINSLITSVNTVEPRNIEAYPNPGNGIINISGAGNGDFHYSVFNASGICLVNEKHLSDNGIIDISQLPNGLYLIRMKSGDKVITVRYSLIR